MMLIVMHIFTSIIEVVGIRNTLGTSTDEDLSLILFWPASLRHVLIMLMVGLSRHKMYVLIKNGCH